MGRPACRTPGWCRARRLTSHGAGWDADDAFECTAEGRFRSVAEATRELCNRDSLLTESAEGEMHAPAGHVLHDRLADQLREARRESRARDGELSRERSNRPLPRRLAVDQGDRAADVPVLERAEPASARGRVGLDPGADRLDDEDVAEAA